MLCRLSINVGAASVGHFMRDHQRAIRYVQWFIVGFYLFLLTVPVFISLPGNTASVFNHLTIFAQFAFWGIWWPFVLVSIPLLGRTWCGVFCPEGALTEWASRHGRGRAIPKWVRWSGWPFIAFCLTTVYGQLISVYQYPWAAATILGGSTVAAMLVGWLYGRNKRVWCKYLCPVSGVFGLLAKLSPWYYRVDVQAWRDPVRHIEPINCAPLLPLRHMKGSSECHMCGRCSDYRGAISLAARSPESEILYIAEGSVWQTSLLVFGMMGLAVGAFLWSVSPWYITIKQYIAIWLVNHNVYWPLSSNAPWFVLTNYPQVNDSFSWLDGVVILTFIGITAAITGGALFISLWLTDKVLPYTANPGVRDGNGTLIRSRLSGLHKLAQGLIPVAGMGVFLGLSATTIKLLKHEGIAVGWANAVRFTLLAMAVLWSLRLIWQLAGLRTSKLRLKLFATCTVACGMLPFCWAWVLLFVR